MTGTRRGKVTEVNGRRIAALLIAALALVAAGCGGSSSSESSSDTTTEAVATETVASTATSTTEDSMATEADTGTSGQVALGGKCADLVQIGQKFSEAMSGQDANFQDASKYFDELAGQVPDEIKPDFQVLAKNFQKLAEALKGVDLQSGQTPSPEALAKLQQLASSMDSAEVRQATAHIEAWAKTNC
jgi:ABC-type Fe3+-hydroxamate transport system substrate-binding protein